MINESLLNCVGTGSYVGGCTTHAVIFIRKRVRIYRWEKDANGRFEDYAWLGRCRFHNDDANVSYEELLHYINFVFRRITRQTSLLEKRKSSRLTVPCRVWLKCRPHSIGSSGSTTDNDSVKTSANRSVWLRTNSHSLKTKDC